MNYVLLENNSSGTKKTDTRHHLGRYARGVLEVGTKTLLRDKREQRTSQSNEEVGTKAGILGTQLALKTNKTSHGHCGQQSQKRFLTHHPAMWVLATACL